jgi:putrescine aminotransferase
MNNTAATTSDDVFKGYDQRFWRFLSEMQRASGMKFVIGRREGSYFWSLEGDRRLLDCGNSGGVHSLGHRNPEILQVLLDALSYLDAGIWTMPTPEHLALRDVLAACTPAKSIVRSVATLSSTASIDLALLFSFRMTGRRKALAYRHGYHGHSGFAAMVTGSEAEGIFGHYPVPEDRSEFFDEYGSLDSIATRLDDECAAVILEPMNYETFEPAPSDFLPGLADMCRKRGALLIIDETRTGVSRSGRLWMTSHYDFQPDMLILGKGLGAGLYPVSVLLTREDIYDYCMNSKKLGYISSMAVSPIGAIVACKVLEIAQRSSFLENVAQLECAMTRSFNDLCATYPDVYAPASVLGGIGTLGLKDAALATIIKGELFKRNVFCHSASLISPHVVKFFPCLTSNPVIVEEISEALASIAKWRQGSNARPTAKE